MSGSLAHLPEDIVRYLLIDLSVGTLPSDVDDWPIYATQEPDKPDNVITVYGTEGNKHGRCIGLLHLPCKSGNSEGVKKDVAAFRLGDCSWKICYTSDPKTKKGHFGVVVDCNPPRKNQNKSICFNAHMYILGKSKTHEVISSNVNVETGGFKINFATIKLTNEDLSDDFFEKSYLTNETKKVECVSIPLVMYIDVISVNGQRRKRQSTEL